MIHRVLSAAAHRRPALRAGRQVDETSASHTATRSRLRTQEQEIEPQRRPLELAVERAVLELRQGLELMDARLRPSFSPSFIESLYPDLSRGARAVAAEDDEDDDDSEEPVTPAVTG